MHAKRTRKLQSMEMQNVNRLYMYIQAFSKYIYCPCIGIKYIYIYRQFDFFSKLMDNIFTAEKSVNLQATNESIKCERLLSVSYLSMSRVCSSSLKFESTVTVYSSSSMYLCKKKNPP